MPAVIVLGLSAIGTYRTGVTDFRYQLAGQADPFLGHPSPVLTCIVGVILTLILVGGTAVVRHVRKSAPPAGPMVAWRMEWLLVAGWVGYAAGAGVVLAAGAPVVSSGTIRYELGAPINAVAVVDATCTSIVGDPSTMAQVNPTINGVLAVNVRSEVTGAADPIYVWTQRGLPGADQREPLPVPDRPAITETVVGVDNTIVQRLSFADVYDYRVVRHSDGARTGAVELAATRTLLTDFPPSRSYQNAQIANDPWPSEFSLVLRWNCPAIPVPSQAAHASQGTVSSPQ